VLLHDVNRAIVLGIGGGGDVVGALAAAMMCLESGVEAVVGGVSWERLPIDPVAGPRSVDEIVGGRRLAPLVIAADAQTATSTGVPFAESRMSGFLGETTLLVDPNGGPAAIAESLALAATQLDADLVIFLDVGGDVLGAGTEPGLASPLCDAVMLAAAADLQQRGVACVGALFGACCDGELTLLEVLERLAAIAAGGGMLGVRTMSADVADRLDAATRVVPTEASAMAIRCARGEIGDTTIRGGRRSVTLSPVGAMTFYFDPALTIEHAAPLAAALRAATSLEQGNAILHGMGVRTELDYEQENTPLSPKNA